MNLITPVIVETSIEQARDDRQSKKAYIAERLRRLEPIIHDLFEKIDVDCNGHLDIDEVVAASSELKDELIEVTGMDDISGAFSYLDDDGSGTISATEFHDGIVRIASAESPIELMTLQAELRRQKLSNIKILSEVHQDLSESIRFLHQDLRLLHQKLELFHQDFAAFNRGGLGAV